MSYKKKLWKATSLLNKNKVGLKNILKQWKLSKNNKKPSSKFCKM